MSRDCGSGRHRRHSRNGSPRRNRISRGNIWRGWIERLYRRDLMLSSWNWSVSDCLRGNSTCNGTATGRCRRSRRTPRQQRNTLLRHNRYLFRRSFAGPLLSRHTSDTISNGHHGRIENVAGARIVGRVVNGSDKSLVLARDCRC